MILASLSVIRGVSTIEPLNKVVVPILLAIILFSFYWAIFLPYANVGIEKFFSPNWGKLVTMSLKRVNPYTLQHEFTLCLHVYMVNIYVLFTTHNFSLAN